MTVFTRARGVRFRLLCRAAVQFMAATGLALASLSVNSADGALSLLVCLALAGICFYFGVRTVKERSSFKPQAAAEKVLRQLMPDFEDKGWLVARQRNLPAECRGYMVIFPPSGELGFVIGLSGDWPDRGSLEDPQRVASELSAYGRPHVPVCLAAFVTGYGDDYPFGVLSTTPTRLLDALEETEQSFVDERAAALERIRLAHLPPEPLAGTVPMEETFAEPATDFADDPTEQEVM